MSSLVTLGVPVFNGERYIATTVQSLLAQTYRDIEVVVSDNGSTDRTVEIVHDLAQSDDRVRLFRGASNRGAGWNYNRVLELARGDYFKWAAADDVCAATFVAKCVGVLEECRDAVLAYPQTVLIDARGSVVWPLDDRDLHLTQPRPHERLRQLLQHRVEWHPVFGVIRTADLRRTRGIGNFLLADVALLAELAMLGQFHQVPERLFLRRYHDERSVIAHATPVEQLRWYDPGVRQRVVFQQVRLTYELLAAVRRAPLPLSERARGAQSVLRSWAIPHWRHMGGEAKIALRQLTAHPRRAQ